MYVVLINFISSIIKKTLLKNSECSIRVVDSRFSHASVLSTFKKHRRRESPGIGRKGFIIYSFIRTTGQIQSIIILEFNEVPNHDRSTCIRHHLAEFLERRLQ